jgi:hypothetical protein
MSAELSDYSSKNIDKLINSYPESNFFNIVDYLSKKFDVNKTALLIFNLYFLNGCDCFSKKEFAKNLLKLQYNFILDETLIPDKDVRNQIIYLFSDLLNTNYKNELDEIHKNIDLNIDDKTKLLLLQTFGLKNQKGGLTFHLIVLFFVLIIGYNLYNFKVQLRMGSSDGENKNGEIKDVLKHNEALFNKIFDANAKLGGEVKENVEKVIELERDNAKIAGEEAVKIAQIQVEEFKEKNKYEHVEKMKMLDLEEQKQKDNMMIFNEKAKIFDKLLEQAKNLKIEPPKIDDCRVIAGEIGYEHEIVKGCFDAVFNPKNVAVLENLQNALLLENNPTQNVPMLIDGNNNKDEVVNVRMMHPSTRVVDRKLKSKSGGSKKRKTIKKQRKQRKTNTRR